MSAAFKLTPLQPSRADVYKFNYRINIDGLYVHVLGYCEIRGGTGWRGLEILDFGGLRTCFLMEAPSLSFISRHHLRAEPLTPPPSRLGKRIRLWAQVSIVATKDLLLEVQWRADSFRTVAPYLGLKDDR